MILLGSVPILLIRNSWVLGERLRPSTALLQALAGLPVVVRAAV